MQVIKRAILYIKRKWKKCFLIFFISIAVSSLVLAGLAVLDAQEEKSAELRGTTGTSFTISRNTASGGWSSNENGSYSTQESIPDEMLNKISDINGIKGFNATITSIFSFTDSNGKVMEHINPIGAPLVDCQYYVIGSLDSQYNSLFLSGAFSLVDGYHITKDDKNGVLISKDVVDKQGLAVGDTFLAVNNPNSNDPVVKLKITGIFDVVADKIDEKNNYNMASYYDYSNYAFIGIPVVKEALINYPDVADYDSADFFVDDPKQLETIIQNVQSISSINWDNFILSTNDEVYERASNSMSNIGTLITTMIAITVVISTIVIILILSMWIKSRKKEIGILLALGISKIAIVAQYIVEVFVIALCAFLVTIPFSKILADTLSSMFGKTSDSVIVTQYHFMLVMIYGIFILTASVIIACIPIMKFKPKDIFSQME